MAAVPGQQEHLVPLLIVFAVSTFLVVVVAVFTLIRLRKDVNRRLSEFNRRGARPKTARRIAPTDPNQWQPFSMPVLPFWQQLALGAGTLLACAVGVCELLAGATIPQTLAPVVLPLLLLRPAPKSTVPRSLWAVVVGCFAAAILLLGVLSLRLLLRQA
ncbi:hypothetical protein [Hymenobacter sp. GOD-10R]|uniref:hypothetical protein n=1 Tax=Hymenobacter sp. GOD-10R TaxID=3093922 RepID=UPI002D78AB4A|nr:hypothetical protein [Hymenobacter sp. GOD-10R]WRQ30795.1 hypothetical protein SD425_11030 [Hymenobacter sp. GOD-10R]